MFDPISQALTAVGARSAYAIPLVFLAGAVSSIGPCVAPRFVAVAGLASGKPRSQAITRVLWFVGGLVATYAVFGAISTLVERAADFSTLTYTVVAIALGGGGVLALWRGEEPCAHEHVPARDVGNGGAALFGASFALVVSPCCTPLVLGIIAYTSGAGNITYGSALLACFALGHALPLVVVAFGMNRATAMLRRYSIHQAAGMVSAALMLALCAYYAVLA